MSTPSRSACSLVRIVPAARGWAATHAPAVSVPVKKFITALRDRCLAAQVPFFFKQWGGRTPKQGGRLLDGRSWDQMPAPALAATA